MVNEIISDPSECFNKSKIKQFKRNTNVYDHFLINRPNLLYAKVIDGKKHLIIDLPKDPTSPKL